MPRSPLNKIRCDRCLALVDVTPDKSRHVSTALAGSKCSYILRLDYEFEAHSSVATPSEDPRTAIFDQFAYTPGPTNFVSLRAGTTIERWNVSAFVDNLLDAHVVSPPSADPHTGVDPNNANPPSVLIRAYALRPRTIGITATYHL